MSKYPTNINNKKDCYGCNNNNDNNNNNKQGELNNSEFPLPIKEKQNYQKNDNCENNVHVSTNSKYLLSSSPSLFEYDDKFDKEIEERERYYENMIKKLEEHEEREILLLEKKKETL